MEDSRSYIKTLEEYGRKTGREVKTDIKTYKRMRGIGQYGEPETWFLYMEDRPGSNNFLACYYGSNLEVGKYRTFCGVFLPVNVSAESQLLLYQSDVLDKVFGLFRKKRENWNSNRIEN